jgi:hypothetical protein
MLWVELKYRARFYSLQLTQYKKIPRPLVVGGIFANNSFLYNDREQAADAYVGTKRFVFVGAEV